MASSSSAEQAMASESKRAFIVFGDSVVDSGNNNYLMTIARANRPPYGIDTPSHQPTGRFSNGLNLADLVGEAMGLDIVLPYLNPKLKGRKLLSGANFASAGVGILSDTGYQFVNIIRIYQQLELFQEYQERVAAIIGAEQTKQLVNKAVVLINLGGNDFVNNYFLIFSIRKLQYSLPEYCKFLISDYKIILQKLYELGARRVLVFGTGAMGCVPAELALSGSKNGECSPVLQEAATIFDSLLFLMIKELNSLVGSDVYIAASGFSPISDVIKNPHKHGFQTSTMACCGQGPYNGLGLCLPKSKVCSNRDKYVFWDNFHPSERTLRVMVDGLKNGAANYVYPMNLSTVMTIDAS
ncbi:GDSL esterase/lipase At4g28780 [Euphorbia peplus]|nr:GDSL esterase/lipase At4g28780 [Euphorbia peplus]